MIWRILPLAFLMASGCDDGATAEAEPNQMEAPSRAPSHPVATLSCTNNGNAIGVAFCIAASRDNISGSLKIRSGDSVTQYSELDLYNRFREPTVKVPLDLPFEITAQSSSDENFVLRIVIEDGGETVFRDETSRLGVISVDSDGI